MLQHCPRRAERIIRDCWVVGFERQPEPAQDSERYLWYGVMLLPMQSLPFTSLQILSRCFCLHWVSFKSETRVLVDGFRPPLISFPDTRTMKDTTASLTSIVWVAWQVRKTNSSQERYDVWMKMLCRWGCLCIGGVCVSPCFVGHTIIICKQEWKMKNEESPENFFAVKRRVLKKKALRNLFRHFHRTVRRYAIFNIVSENWDSDWIVVIQIIHSHTLVYHSTPSFYREKSQVGCAQNFDVKMQWSSLFEWIK
jgi:hypothetical protein